MQDTRLIIQNINRFVPLSEQDAQQLLAIAQVRPVRKRQFLVQPGFVCTHQIFVIKGALCSYFVAQDGSEHTIQFAIEDWFISDFNSYITQTPASLFVEALEDAQVLMLPFDGVEQLCLNNPKFERFFRMSAQKAFAYAQRRILSNLDKTAEGRFLEFSQLYPGIVSRVPQYMLASYLGITPEFLSKIRKKVARQT